MARAVADEDQLKALRLGQGVGDGDAAFGIALVEVIPSFVGSGGLELCVAREMGKVPEQEVSANNCDEQVADRRPQAKPLMWIWERVSRPLTATSRKRPVTAAM